MRGKPSSAFTPTYSHRITPAHAGKTPASACMDWTPRDHPRACGENVTSSAIQARKLGSPPRMRGKPFHFSFPLPLQRITPAHAGKTKIMRRTDDYPEDHPRACGENGGTMTAQEASEGSPPRMRGKHFARPHKSPRRRITPAHAGKTGDPHRRPLIYEDHPRACGENKNFLRKFVAARGSPPRMRGKLNPFAYPASQIGITPAHAGKTVMNDLIKTILEDHPRACGENRKEIMAKRAQQGSPPRMRGKRGISLVLIALIRITPAHAGKTRKRRRKRQHC